MAIKRKQVFDQGLSQIQTLISEEAAVSKYFNITDVPNELPMGKSSMLIMGSKFLKDNVVIKMELIDNAGTPIYLEPVFGYEESNGIRVGIEIYPDVAPGAATLTMLGELDPEQFEEPIPPEFQGIYNVKYTRTITINKTIPNSRPIRFHKRPTINISEVIKGQITADAATTGSLSQDVGFLVGVPSPGTEGNKFQIDAANYGEIPTYTNQVYGFNPIGSSEEYEIPNSAYTFTLENANFSSSMVGGTLTITDPSASPNFQTSATSVTPSYSARISKVVNRKTIEVQKPFGIYDSGSGEYLVSSMASSSYTINWPNVHEYVSSSVNFKSFADVRLSNLRTFSGDVQRVAVYVKNNGPFGSWSKIIDTPVESPELLVDNLSLTNTTRIGFYSGDDVFTTYWNAFSGSFGTANALTLQTYAEDDYLQNALIISSSTSHADSRSDSQIKLQLKSDYKMDFIEDTQYRISGKIVSDNRLGTKNTVRAQFHMSGSAFGMSDDSGDLGYGRLIGALEYNDAVGKVSGIEDPTFEIVFEPDMTGDGVLQIAVSHGVWQLSEVSVRPNSDTNFSPEFIRLIGPVPPLQTRPDFLDFAVEFYDINNNKAKTVITTQPDNPGGIKFDGENMNILGEDNLIGGSLFIGGDSIGTGIQMGGTTSQLPETGQQAGGSGFLRSLGYQGFVSASAENGSNTGFMIYSGSVLPNTGNDYAGVGLELVGESGSLRFGTNPSRFEVIADAFFVGTTGSQFISGSEGIIEISSSAFHLSSSGDVVMSGSVTAASGKIGGWEIIDGKLSGSNATLDAGGSALYKSDTPPDTHPLTGFYIDFTPGGYYVRFGSDFAVSSSGQLIASGAKIEGVLTASEGFIADWTIAPGALHKTTGGKVSGLSSTGDTRFFAGADSLTQSGSSLFNVKSDGALTSSNFFFDGSGVITGSVVIGTSATILGDLSANTINTPAAGPFLSTINSEGFARFVSASIGGFSVGDNLISSSNLILHSEGRIETANFVSSLLGAGEGWRINSDGVAEFENAIVRGTLRTATFEKNTISAVGGQLILANAATISGSVDYNFAATQSIVLDNIGGFVPGDFLVAKVTGSTGFVTEYMLINSTGSQDSTGGGTVELYRARDGNSVPTMSRGQTVVGQGRVGTGYIHMNADPADLTTPYIDIAERTGSAVGDVSLEVRLGDLSGLSQARLHGTNPSQAGHGLYSKNVFLEGAIVATSGSIGGINMQSSKLYTGNGTFNNTNTGFYLDSSSNFSLQNKFSFNGSSNELSVSGSGVTIGAATFKLDTDNFDVDSSAGELKLGPTPNISGGNGVFMSSSGEFRMGDDDGHIRFEDGSFHITGSDLNIGITQLNISSSGFTVSSPEKSMSLGDDRELLMDGDGGTGGAPIIKLDGGEISSSKFQLDTAGFITASGGKLGAWTVDDDSIFAGNKVTTGGYAASGSLTITGSGGIHANQFFISSSGEAFFAGEVALGTKMTAGPGGSGGSRPAFSDFFGVETIDGVPRIVQNADSVIKGDEGQNLTVGGLSGSYGEANTSASFSISAATVSTVKASEAVVASGSSAEARDDSNVKRLSAASSATVSSDKATSAGSSATVSNEQAVISSNKATSAGSSATAASGSKAQSEDFKVQSGVFRTQASGSKAQAEDQAIVSSNKATSAGSSATLSDSRATVSGEQATISTNKATSAGSSATLASGSKAQAEDQAIVSANKATSAGSSATLSTSSATVSDEKATISTNKATSAGSSATAASGSKAQAEDQKVLSTSSATVSGNKATSAGSSATLSTSSATVSDEKAQSAGSSATVSNEQAVISSNKATSAGSSATVSDSRATVSSEQATTSTQQATISTNKATSAGSSATVSSNKATSASSSATVSDSRATVSSEQATVSTNKATSAGSSATVSSNKATSSASSATLSDSSSTVSSEQATVSTNKATSAGSSATVSSNKATSSASSATLSDSSSTVSTEQATTSTQQATISTNKATSAGSSATVSSNKATSSASSATLSDSSSTVSSEQATTSTQQATISTNKATSAGSSATVSSNKATSSASSATLSDSSSTVSSEQATVSTNKATSAGSSATVSSNKATSSASSATLSDSSSTVSSEQATVSTNKATSAGSSATVSNEQAVISSNKATSASSSATVSDSRATVSSEQATTSTQQATISTNKATSAGSSATVSSNKATSSASSATLSDSSSTVSSEQATTSTQQATISTNKATSAGSSATVSSNKATSSASSATLSDSSSTVSSEQATTSTQQATISTNKATSAGSSATVSSNKATSSASSATLSDSSSTVSSEQATTSTQQATISTNKATSAGSSATVSSNKATSSASSATLSDSSSTVSSEQATTSTQQATISTNKATSAGSSATVSANKATSSASSATLSDSSSTVSSEQATTSTQQATISTNKATSAGSSATVSSNKATSSASSATLSDSSSTVSSEQATTSTQQATISTNKATSAGSSATVSSNKATSSASSATLSDSSSTVSSEQATTSTQQATISANKATSAGSSATVSNEQAVISANKATSASSSATVSDSRATVSSEQATTSTQQAQASAGSATQAASSGTVSTEQAQASAGSATQSSQQATVSTEQAQASAGSATQSSQSAGQSSTSASTSTSSATASGDSATAAASSGTVSTEQAQASAGSATQSSQQATVSTEQAQASAGSATASSQSAGQSSTSASTSTSSATASGNAATQSSNSATTSTQQAQNSASSATLADSSGTVSTEQAQASGNSATQSSQSAGQSSTSASTSTSSATASGNSATQSSQSAGQSSTSASTSTSSATASGNSATQSSNSATTSTQQAQSSSTSASTSTSSATVSGTFKTQAEGFKDQANTFKTQASASKAEAEDEKVLTIGFKTQAETFKTQADTARSSAVVAKTQSEGFSTQAEDFRDDAEDAKSDAQTAKTQAQTAKTQSESARDTSNSSATVSTQQSVLGSSALVRTQGGAAITMSGGEINVPDASNPKFHVDTSGNTTISGSLKVFEGQAGSSDFGIDFTNDGSGDMFVRMKGANPKLVLNEHDGTALGTPSIRMVRGSTGNGFSIGGGTDTSADNMGDGHFVLGTSNQPSVGDAESTIKLAIGSSMYDNSLDGGYYGHNGGSDGASYGYAMAFRSGSNMIKINDLLGSGGYTWSYHLDVGGTIRATGDVIAYSDGRLKHNIEHLTGSLAKVLMLDGVTYEWKQKHDMMSTDNEDMWGNNTGQPEGRKYGFIAQDVEDIIPYSINEDAAGYKNMSYGPLVAVLVQAMQEQQSEIDGLKEDIKKIKEEVM